MKKYLSLIIVSSLFVGFVAYATVQTNLVENQNLPDEMAVNDDSQIQPSVLEIILTKPDAQITPTEIVKEPIVIDPIVEKINIPIVTPAPVKNVVKQKPIFYNEEYDD
jgi:hypothetical protein